MYRLGPNPGPCSDFHQMMGESLFQILFPVNVKCFFKNGLTLIMTQSNSQTTGVLMTFLLLSQGYI